MFCLPSMAVGQLKIRNGLCIRDSFVNHANVRIIAVVVIHSLLFLGLSITLRESVRVFLRLVTLCLSWGLPTALGPLLPCTIADGLVMYMAWSPCTPSCLAGDEAGL